MAPKSSKPHASQQRAATDGLQRASSIPSRRRSSSHLPLLPQAHRGKDVESQESCDDELPQTSWSLGQAIPGPVALLSVAFLWGTYGPTLRVLYSLPHPPDAAALTAARGVLQAGSLWVTSMWMGSLNHPTHHPRGKDQRPGNVALRAGAELGFWNFLATSLQAIGLEHTTAVRGGFIIQSLSMELQNVQNLATKQPFHATELPPPVPHLGESCSQTHQHHWSLICQSQATALLTPVLATVTGEVPGRNVWVGCGVALASTVLITLDSADPSKAVSTASLISLGDAAVFGAAFFYSVTTVRLGSYAQQLPAISLASAKSNALAVWALVWLAFLSGKGAGNGQPALASWQAFSQPQLWLLILWSALGPGALAAFLQSKGQSNVPSSQAQVYYSSTPIWSALLAILLIKGESMGALGWLGGAGIIFAGLLASR